MPVSRQTACENVEIQVIVIDHQNMAGERDIVHWMCSIQIHKSQ
jgi:hypothetical protein